MATQMQKNIIVSGGDKMAEFFCNDPVIKAEFEKLPAAVQESIMESGVPICTVEELKQLADSIEKNM